MAKINVTNLNGQGIDNLAATEDDGSTSRPDLVISIQPRQGESSRAELPVSTVDWRSNPRGQFIPVHGLDFLIGVSSLQIQQTVELDDLISKIDSENRYIVRVPNGESLYLASEVSSQTQRCLCGSGRAFVMHLHDNTRQEALQLQRRLAAASCCFPCRLQEMKVITPPGDYIGRVQQRCTWMVPFYLVRDANDQVLFAIEGPAVMKRSALMLSEFKIMTGDSLREVGKIAHGWDRDLVSFTTTLTIPNTAVQPRHKALLLAASFLMSIEWYSGRFIRDTMHGQGEYRCRYQGRRGLFITYEGNFYVNRMHGYGAMSYPDGKVFTGLFNNNFRYGPGIETFPDRRANVGLWRGTKLVRLAWRPGAPSVVPELHVGPLGRLFVEPHRVILNTTFQTIGKINNAIELLKECGSEPIMAAENWTKLYPKYCTDTTSQLCHVELFENEYYNGKIYSLQRDSDVRNNEDLDQDSQDSFEDIGPYYAWNNNEMAIDMMKHCFKHEKQRDSTRIDLLSVLTGPRKHFQRAAIHELDSRTLLMASYLGHVASTTYLVNERRVDPNIADMQGNSAVMYATCGDQLDIMNFLIEAGANVDSYNDSCCTALGIALIRLICAQRDISIGAAPQAVIPPPMSPPTPAEEPKAFEWNIIRDLPPPGVTLAKSPSKVVKMNTEKTITKKEKSSTSLKDANKKKTETSKPVEDMGYESDESSNEENKLFKDINYEYAIKVNDPLPASGPPVYIFDVNDMVKDLDAEEKIVPDKNPKKQISKVLKETTKPSKEVMWQNFERDEGASLSSVEKYKIETLERIKSTILQLLDKGARPNLVKCPHPALFMAVVSGYSDILRHLLKYGAEVSEVYPHLFNYTILDIAVSRPITYDNLEIIRALLESGAQANHRLRYVIQPPPNNPELEQEMPGPTLLHAVLARKVESEYEDEIRKQILELLLEYNCDPLAQFKGRSAFDIAAKSMDLLDIVIRNPKTDLNAIINESQQTILVKMFSMPYFKTIDNNDRLQTLTNLLLFGASPLIECRNGEVQYRNLFVLTKNVRTDLESSPVTKTSPAPVGKNEKAKKEPKKEEKPKPVGAAKSTGKIATDDIGNYRQAIDLITECARLLHIRWLQGKLTKELIQIIDKHKHRHWNAILREHKNKKSTGLWLTAQRCLEIWDLLKTTKRKIYNDKRTLKHLLCIVHFYSRRSKISHRFDSVTSEERNAIEYDVNYMIHEHKKTTCFEPEMLPLQRLYVQPELFVRAESEFGVCFECALPLEEERIQCQLCKLVSFCDLECIRINIDRTSCHPCSDYFRQRYFPSPPISDDTVNNDPV